MATERHEDKVRRHAEERLVLEAGAKPSRILGKYKNFLKVEQHRLRIWHRSGGGGLEVAHGRSQMMDILLRHILKAAEAHHKGNGTGKPVSMALVAIGGYGRGELCPFSDIDIMFLHDGAERGGKNDPYVAAVVEEVLYMLWDIGLKIGHSTRTVEDAVAQANEDMQSKTALIESRLVDGDIAERGRRRSSPAAASAPGRAWPRRSGSAPRGTSVDRAHRSRWRAAERTVPTSSCRFPRGPNRKKERSGSSNRREYIASRLTVNMLAVYAAP